MLAQLHEYLQTMIGWAKNIHVFEIKSFYHFCYFSQVEPGHFQALFFQSE